MPTSSVVRWLCHAYAILLYCYPRDFRRQYGREMRQVFGDRCRDLARTHGRLRWLRFALHTGADWLATTTRERLDASSRHLRAAWSIGRQPRPRSFVAEWAVTILVYLFATTTLVQAYVIPTGSMEGNLRIGDHMLVDRMAYADPGPLGRHLLPYRDIQRGDIVAFLYPEDIRQTYVKRVIGLPGDRIHLENKQVVRNGRLLIEPYTRHIANSMEPYRDDFPTSPDPFTTPRGRDMFAHYVRAGELIVPPGTLFMMGDNRENSADSRYWGLVPREYVVGKPLIVYWSFDAPTSELEEWSLAHVLDVAQHFFTKTRWERTLLRPRAQPALEAGGRP